jgi:serine protease
MASPHVAGVAALYLAANANANPSQVKAALVAGSVSGKVTDVKGSPNLLINTGFLLSSTPPNPPASNILNNGTLVSALVSERTSEEKTYTVVVPANSKNLSISIFGGRGDADLYVKFGAKPTSSSYDCRPYKTGNSETCTVVAPKAGTYYVSVRTYAPYSGLNLKAEFAKK